MKDGYMVWLYNWGQMKLYSENEAVACKFVLYN